MDETEYKVVTIPPLEEWTSSCNGVFWHHGVVSVGKVLKCKATD